MKSLGLCIRCSDSLYFHADFTFRLTVTTAMSASDTRYEMRASQLLGQKHSSPAFVPISTALSTTMSLKESSVG